VVADNTTTPAEDEIATEDTGAAPDENRVEEAEIVDPEPTAAAAPAPQGIEARRGPGISALLLGGVIAAGLGYGAAYLGYLPGQSADIETPLAGISEQLETQTSALSALTERTGAIEAQIAALPAPPEPVDLTPLSARIDAVGTRIAANEQSLQGLTDRVAYLETLPAGSGDGADNSAAIAAAVAQLQAALQEQTASLAAQQAENTALSAQLQDIATAAEDRIAAAEARAEARVGGATAQAALGQLQIAVATGAPFAGALADVAGGAGIAVPEALQATAETGVPTLDDLQSTFPAAARAALPIAIRETAGEGTMNRVTAFLQSQVGGRSLEPQEGDSADAVLSRAEDAMQSGDVGAALAEIATLPAAAQEVLTVWVEAAGARVAATDAMAEFAAALDAANQGG
jgi:hypothetical protein